MSHYGTQYLIRVRAVYHVESVQVNYHLSNNHYEGKKRGPIIREVRHTYCEVIHRVQTGGAIDMLPILAAYHWSLVFVIRT